jgi:hypothetical protein
VYEGEDIIHEGILLLLLVEAAFDRLRLTTVNGGS